MLGLDVKQRFVDLLEAKLSENLPISQYSKQYLKRILPQAYYFATIYEQLILKLCKRLDMPINELKVMDFGGGLGLFSCYMKFIGVKTVYYLDHYPDAAKDAHCIAKHLELLADCYHCGTFSSFLAPLDGIVSTDVWEHVYDVVAWQKEVNANYPYVVQLHATGANPYHFWNARKLKKIHISNEYTDRPIPIGAKQTDSYQAYFSMRLRYIEKKFPTLTSSEQFYLAQQTRGLVYDDIEAEGMYFRENKTLLYKPQHPTNTCNPETGNWSERLYDIKEMRLIAMKCGWYVKLHSIGYNPKPKEIWKKPILGFINWMGMILPFCASFILPLLVWEFYPQSKVGKD